MGGKLFITILGLLLVQALGAIFFGMTHNDAFELLAAVLFLLSGVVYLLRKVQGHKRFVVPALLGFAFGFVHVVYLSFVSVSLWLVILLCLNAAGFVLSLDRLAVKHKPLPLPVHARKVLLDKELPLREKAEVTVYDVAPQKTRATSTKKASKKAKAAKKKSVKKASKKVAKKKTTKKKATKKNVPKKKSVKKVSKKSVKRPLKRSSKKRAKVSKKK